MAKIRRLTTPNVGKEMAQDSYTLGGNVKWCVHFGKQFGNFLSKYLTYGPTFHFYTFTQEKRKLAFRPKTYTQMIILPLFVISKNWK